MKIKSFILVFFQILLIILFFSTGPWLAVHTIWLFFEVCGAGLFIWAVIHMRANSKFSGLPEPAAKAKLLESGPYTYIRNPMYSAILFMMIVLLLDFYTDLRLVSFILELLVLLVKISREEKFLTEKFKRYATYKSRTRRLIPFIY